jgi:hypothetical protein
MRRPTYDPTNVHRANQLGIKRIRDVVLAHLSRTPARSVEEAIINREVDVRK